jgi:hypothetical protein
MTRRSRCKPAKDPKIDLKKSKICPFSSTVSDSAHRPLAAIASSKTSLLHILILPRSLRCRHRKRASTSGTSCNYRHLSVSTMKRVLWRSKRQRKTERNSATSVFSISFIPYRKNTFLIKKKYWKQSSQRCTNFTLSPLLKPAKKSPFL